ncbi:MAG: hypothetical protein ACRELV_08445, partial [Longimicrobiales bacterium]
TPHPGGDNAAYLSIARGMLEGGMYADYWDPLRPPHTQYPPVFPIMLALAQLFAIDGWVGQKLVIIACSSFAVAFSYLWVRRWHSASLALPVGLIVAFGPGVIDLSHWVLSDVPFWMFLMIALWAWTAVDGTALKRARLMRLVEETETGVASSPWSRGVVSPDPVRLANVRDVAAALSGVRDALSRPVWIAVVATMLAYFTRSAGLPLVLAAGVWLLWQRRWRPLALLAALVGAPALLWALRTRALGGIGYEEAFLAIDPYQPELGTIGMDGMIDRVLSNIGDYIGVHLPMLLFGDVGPFRVLLGGLVLALGIAGWAVRLRRPGIAELFLPMYLGLLVIWPAVWSGERFLLPVLPIIVAAAGAALLELARRATPRRVSLVGAVATALVLLFAAPGLRAGVRGGFICTTRYASGEDYPCLAPVFGSFFEMAEWSRDALPPAAVVITRKPTLWYWVSGRPSRIYPKSENPTAFWAMIRETDARYLLFDRIGGLTMFYVGPIVARNPEAFCVVRVAPDQTGVLFGIREVPTASPAGPPPASPSFDRCPPSYAPGAPR